MEVRLLEHKLHSRQHLVVRQLHIHIHHKMTKKKSTTLNIDKLLAAASETEPNRWELDNIVWHDRTTNPTTLVAFLERIKTLTTAKARTAKEDRELEILSDLANSLDEEECLELLSGDDELAQQTFIENLARQGALETLCDNKLSQETMEKMCKLSPSDFILAAKRSQDIINSIQELVIQAETLSSDVAGA